MTEHAGLIQVTTFRPAPGRRDEVLALCCHPPAAWDQVEGFSAMSMGPPGRQ